MELSALGWVRAFFSSSFPVLLSFLKQGPVIPLVKDLGEQSEFSTSLLVKLNPVHLEAEINKEVIVVNNMNFCVCFSMTTS